MFPIFRKLLISCILLSHQSLLANDFVADGRQSNQSTYGFVGLGVGMVPEYEGASDYQTIPFLAARVANENRYLELIGLGARANIINHAHFQFGPVLRFRFGRDSDVDNTTIASLEEIDDAFEAGLFTRWDVSKGWVGGDSLGMELQVLQDVSNVHQGYTASIAVDYNAPITSSTRVGVDLSTNYGSSDFMNRYYSIDSSNVGSSGLSDYDADSGFNNVTIGFNGQHRLTGNWALFSRFSYSRLIGDAADSPIIEEGSADQFLFGTGISYRY